MKKSKEIIAITTFDDSTQGYMLDTDGNYVYGRPDDYFRTTVLYDTCIHCGGLNEEKEAGALCEWCGRPVHR